MDERISIIEQEPKSLDTKDLTKLNFESLTHLTSEVLELAKNSFQQTEKGFINAMGETITILPYDNKYIIDAPKRFHRYILDNKILNPGSIDREVIIQELITMLTESECRIIE